MKKRKCITFLCVALSLVMLLSVTGFAGSVSFTADSGASATGSTGYSSGSTSVSSPMYVYVEIDFVYFDSNAFGHTVSNNASNSGTNITTYVSVPSDVARYDGTYGTHVAGSKRAYSEYH